eukprot:UN25957
MFGGSCPGELVGTKECSLDSAVPREGEIGGTCDSDMCVDVTSLADCQNAVLILGLQFAMAGVEVNLSDQVYGCSHQDGGFSFNSNVAGVPDVGGTPICMCVPDCGEEFEPLYTENGSGGYNNKGLCRNDAGQLPSNYSKNGVGTLG